MSRFVIIYSDGSHHSPYNLSDVDKRQCRNGHSLIVDAYAQEYLTFDKNGNEKWNVMVPSITKAEGRK